MVATTNVWYQRHAGMGVCNLLSSVATGTELFAQVTGGTAYAALTEFVENVEVYGGGMDVEVINVCGITQKVLEKKPEMRKCSFDMVYSDSTKMLLNRLYGTAVTAPSGFVRYQGGEKTSSANRAKCAVGAQFTDGTNKVNCLLNNAWMTKYEGPKLNADDYAKVSIEFSCLAADYYEEDNLADS